ncbi:MAG: universal stress protein [Persephonella sp.]|nr:MAG: universal stress protein [Persephonella sp.]RUM60383.1 MAG: universal stress protein [Persephonella sp.]
MISRILVGTDGSQHAITAEEYGIYLSKKLKRPVIAVYIMDKKLISEAIIEDVAAALGFGEYGDITDKIEEYLDEKGKAILKAFAVKCRNAGADCSIAQAIGFVAYELVNMADPEDLLIIGKKGVHEDILPFRLGSTAESIARHSKCPVLLADKEFREIKNIVIGFNGRGKSIKALQFATDLAKNLGLEGITVLSVLNKDDEEIKLQLKQMVKGTVSGIDYQLIFKIGYPEEEILSYTQESETDLLVIGAFGESRLKELILGSTTSFLIQRTDIPVLVVK